jgi:AraC-like DNA-binding protein
VAPRTAALGFDVYSVMGTEVAVGCGTVAVAQAVRGGVSDPVLHLATPPGSIYRVGRRRSAPTGQATVVIVAPEWEFTRVSPPGALLAVKIDQDVLLDELQTRRPSASGHWALRFELLVLTSLERTRLMAAAADLVRMTRPGAAASDRAHAERHVVALVADLMLRDSAASPAGSLDHARARDLENWIDAHLAEPLTLGRLCQVAGVGARCLQKTFEQRRGMPPMRFVTERRLAAAFHRLNHAAPDTRVTRIALELGFGHVGRFAQMYRQVIGESPSHTLARR